MKKYYILVLTMLLATTLVQAQVTIGSANKPINGALLMLNDGTDQDGASAKKGLGLPRVELTDLNKLKMGDNDIANTPIAGSTVWKSHAGLMVYNVSPPIFDPISCKSVGGAGLYVWDGATWQGIGVGIEGGDSGSTGTLGSVTGKSGAVYKTRVFGNAGEWMIENLREIAYDDGEIGTINEDRNTAQSYTNKSYYYPNSILSGDNATTPEEDRQRIVDHPELGLLYSWVGASNGKITDEFDTGAGTERSTVQGICPKGWKLPSDKDFTELEKEIALRPELYSSNAAGSTIWSSAEGQGGNPDSDWAAVKGWRPSNILTTPAHGQSMMSCAAPAGSTEGPGKGLSTDKGFNLLLVGNLHQGSASLYGRESDLWSSSGYTDNSSWGRLMDRSNNRGVYRSAFYHNAMFSVRCKKSQPTGPDGCLELGDRPDNLPEVTTQKTGLDQPNSYIVTGESLVRIPINKAKIIWDGASWKGDTEHSESGINPNMSPVLPTGRTFTNLSAQLVWKDVKCGLINEVKLSDNKDYIEVWVGDAKGNAIIGLKDGDDIVWSWHIWATNKPGTNDFNNLTWLDRNLGAISAEKDKASSIGFHYQWGRKDPFPASDNWNNTELTKVYDEGGTEIDYNNTNYMANAQVGFVDNESRLVYAIQNPLSFIITNYDWYSPSGTIARGLWLSRWGASDGSKTASDPCPEGWRLPLGSNDPVYPWNNVISPWGDLDTSDFGNVVEGDIFKGKLHDEAGFYPTAGFRQNNGSLVRIGDRGNYWQTTPILAVGQSMLFTKAAVHLNYNQYRSNGVSVRCVHE